MKYIKYAPRTKWKFLCRILNVCPVQIVTNKYYDGNSFWMVCPVCLNSSYPYYGYSRLFSQSDYEIFPAFKLAWRDDRYQWFIMKS